jgi:hypothetical protein
MKRFFVITTALMISAANAKAVPINSNEGFTAYQGQWIVRTQARIHLRDDDPTPMDRKMTMVAVPTTVVYGVTPLFTAMATVPYISKDLDLTTATGRIRRGDAAIGDVMLVGKYRVWTLDEPNARTWRLSVLGGASLPTGPDDAADAMGRLPRTLQVGTGTLDPLAGLSFTRWTPFWSVSGDAIYRHGGEDEEYDFADSFRYDFALERAIWPRELPEEGLPDYLYAILELNGEVSGRDRFQAVEQGSTGGHTLYLSPGLQYITARYAVEAGVQIPVMTRMHGLQPEPKATFVLSNRISW